MLTVRAAPGEEVAAPRSGGWAQLFASSFRHSRNGMVLVDGHGRHVVANGAYLKLLGYRRDAVIGRPLSEFVTGGPPVTRAEWQRALLQRRFSGEAALLAGDGSVIGVHYEATSEVVNGQRVVLFVAVRTSRWGRHFRREVDDQPAAGRLSPREMEVVHLVARGRSGPEIADELHVAHGTVRAHVRNAMEKVGARSRAHLVAKVLGGGWLLP